MTSSLTPETVVTFALPLGVLWGIAHTIFKGYLEGQKAKAKVVELEQERDRERHENAKVIADLHREHVDTALKELRVTVKHVEGVVGDLIPRLVVVERACERNTEELRESRKTVTETLGAIKSAIGQLSQYYKTGSK